MKKSIGGLVVCLLGLVACNVEHYDDCDGDGFDDGDAFGGSHSRGGSGSMSAKAGSTSDSAGTASGGTDATSGGTGSAGTAAAAAGGEGGAPVIDVPPDPCDQERDCARGYNCDLEQHECVPAAEETCGELETETACTHRSDCTPVYGGTNCSCGQDCECHGGDPGCVCQSFEFFVCRAVE